MGKVLDSDKTRLDNEGETRWLDCSASRETKHEKSGVECWRQTHLMDGQKQYKGSVKVHVPSDAEASNSSNIGVEQSINKIAQSFVANFSCCTIFKRGWRGE